jgi:phosphate transport system substrate-binding protein
VNLRSIIAAAGLAAAAFAAPATAQEVTGAGATFPFPVYAKWAEAYKAQGGATINYQSIGSGGGIRQIRARTVAFGATDAPLKGEDLEKDGLVQFPTVLGGVVPVVNIQGLQTRQLRLTGELVADIYRGEIKTWNDKRIAELNPGVNLPAGNITPVYRSDGSGTTSIFTTYLSEVSPQWKEKLGSGTTVNWPVGQGGKGNEGVAATVKQVNNSIGYVEYAYAKQNNIPYALMRNKDGQFVAPDDKSFAAAAAGADWSSAPGFGISLTNQPGAEAWPITAATFILIHKEPKDAKAAAEPSSSSSGPTRTVTRWPRA